MCVLRFIPPAQNTRLFCAHNFKRKTSQRDTQVHSQWLIANSSCLPILLAWISSNLTTSIGVEIPLATENLLENTDGVLQTSLPRGVGAPHHCSLAIIVLSGRHPAAFYLCWRAPPRTYLSTLTNKSIKSPCLQNSNTIINLEDTRYAWINPTMLSCLPAKPIKRRERKDAEEEEEEEEGEDDEVGMK